LLHRINTKLQDRQQYRILSASSYIHHAVEQKPNVFTLLNKKYVIRDQLPITFFGLISNLTAFSLANQFKYPRVS